MNRGHINLVINKVAVLLSMLDSIPSKGFLVSKQDLIFPLDGGIKIYTGSKAEIVSKFICGDVVRLKAKFSHIESLLTIDLPPTMDLSKLQFEIVK